MKEVEVDIIAELSCCSVREGERRKERGGRGAYKVVPLNPKGQARCKPRTGHLLIRVTNQMKQKRRIDCIFGSIPLRLQLQN